MTSPASAHDSGAPLTRRELRERRIASGLTAPVDVQRAVLPPGTGTPASAPTAEYSAAVPTATFLLPAPTAEFAVAAPSPAFAGASGISAFAAASPAGGRAWSAVDEPSRGGGRGGAGRGGGSDEDGPRRRPVRNIVFIVLAVLLLAVLWLAFRALTVKNELEASQSLISQVQDGDLDVGDALPKLGQHAEAAAGASADPVWRVFEFVPFVGDNLRGVRLAAESLDVAANDLGGPALTAMADEKSDIPVLGRVLPAIMASAPEISRLATEIEAVRGSAALIGPVRKGVDQVGEVMATAAPLVELMPELLGAGGERNYLLVFQNNAESVGLGGSAASQSLVRAADGAVEIVHQANSDVYANGTPVDVQVPQSALDLYSDYLVHHINTSASRPDFPTMAQIVTAWWQRDVRADQIDGVVSIDPIALGRMLRATGPIELATGDTLTEDNAVQLLLSDVYKRWGTQETKYGADLFFASVAEEIFGKLSSGAFDLKDMAWAVGEGIEAGDIMFYSSHPEVQEVVAPLQLSGILPTTNDEKTTVGVYFRDESASKIDYYMKSAIGLSETCQAGNRTFTAKTNLHLDLDQAAADALPEYVKSQTWGSDVFRTQVYVYGPPGSVVTGAEVEGREVTVKRTDVVDLDRPVAWFETYLRPGEQASVTATFQAPDGEFGPLTLRSTPMINDTEVSQTTTGCAAR